MATPTADLFCAICDTPGVHACSGCHEVRYCSKECQKVDWPIHKLVCKTFVTEFSEAKRPDSKQPGMQHRRAIFFPEDEERPRFIWLPISGLNESGQGIADIAELGPNNSGITHASTINSNAVLHRLLDRHITLRAKVSLINDELQYISDTPNKSLQGVDKELSTFFIGPLLAYGSGENPGDGWANKHPDLGPTDFRHVVDFLRLEHYTGSGEQWTYAIGDGEKIEGVRLNCAGDHYICVRPRYEPVHVLKSFCDAETEISAPMIEKAGVSLVFRRIPYALGWRDGRSCQGIPCKDNAAAAGFDPYRVFDTSHLQEVDLATNPLVPIMMHRMKLSGHMGSLIAVRKDGKPLKPLLMEGLVEYARHKGLTMVFSAHDSSTLADKILASISPEDFKKWYKNYVVARGEGHSVDMDALLD